MSISLKPLVVANMAQKILFLCEMKGQISDGQWENAPGDHWKVWSGLKWSDVGIGSNIGRKFAATRDGYNFANKELVDIVGERMLFYVNIYKNFPEKTEKLLEVYSGLPDSYEQVENIFNLKYAKDKNDPNDWYVKELKFYTDAGFTLADFKTVEENKLYTEKEMLADLSCLKKSFKPVGTFQLNDYGKFLRAVIPPTNYLPRLEELKAMIEKNNF